MSAGFSPLVRRRRLGAEIRQLREHEDLTLAQLGTMVGWSAAKLSRLENARIRPDVGDVMDVLDVLGVSGTRREQLIALARDAANTRGWWNAYSPEIFDRQQAYAEFENGAVQIREFHLSHVPGLLQTRGYAAARFASRPVVGLSAVDTDAAADARLARQRVLTRHPPTAYDALLDESVLARRCGPQGVRDEQLGHLAEVAELPGITLRVLPHDAQVAGGFLPRCSFSLYRFADPVDPAVAVVETETSDLHVTEADDIARYTMVFERLWEAALSAEDSVKLLTAARDHPDHRPPPCGARP